MRALVGLLIVTFVITLVDSLAYAGSGKKKRARCQQAVQVLAEEMWAYEEAWFPGGIVEGRGPGEAWFTSGEGVPTSSRYSGERRQTEDYGLPERRTSEGDAHWRGDEGPWGL